MSSKGVYKFVVTLAIIALILIAGRFLIPADSEVSMYYMYNLTDNTETIVFGISVVLALLCIYLGAFTFKNNDIVSHPLVTSGIVSLLFLTIMVYFSNSMTFGKAISDNMFGQFILTLTIGAEWLALVLYSLKKYPGVEEHK